MPLAVTICRMRANSFDCVIGAKESTSCGTTTMMGISQSFLAHKLMVEQRAKVNANIVFFIILRGG